MYDKKDEVHADGHIWLLYISFQIEPDKIMRVSPWVHAAEVKSEPITLSVDPRDSTRLAHLHDPNEKIVVYCAGGARSALAAQTLKRMGYPNVSSLQGGFGRWKSEGYPWRLPEGLSNDQRDRYSLSCTVQSSDLRGR